MGCRYVLGELCEFRRGASIPRACMLDKGGYLYIHYGDLYKGFSYRIDVKHPQKPIPHIRSDEKIKDSQWLEDQDIVYVLTSETVDDLGHAFLFNNPEHMPAVSGTETTIVHVNRPNVVIPAYLNYLMHAPLFARMLRQYVRGMKVFRVHPDDVARIEVDVPTLDKQRKIVSMLDVIQVKLCINSHTNDYLAALIRLEFDRRFSRETPTIDLGDVMSISTQSIKPNDHIGEIWEHYSIPAYDEMHRPIFELADGIKSNKYVIDSDCILVSKLNPSTKRLWLPRCTSKTSVCSTEFIVYRPKKVRYKSFYYAAIDSETFFAFLLSHVTGSTGSRQRSQPKATLNYPIPNPDAREIEDFCEFADPLIAQQQSNEQETDDLIRLRDTLLPKLISGELNIDKIV